MNQRAKNHLIILSAFLCGVFGYWLARNLQSVTHPPMRTVSTPPAKIPTIRKQPVAPFSMEEPEGRFPDGATVEIFSSCRPNESILRFPTDDSHGGFISTLASSNVRLLDKLDRLRAMRVGYDDPSELALLLHSENITLYRGLPTIPSPTPPGGIVDNDPLGFGNQVMPWLGVTGDHSRWGAGVKIAVIDSGVVSHPGLPEISRSIAIVPFPQDPAATHPHGTAMASLISGTDPNAPGVSPAATLISIRVIDESRQTDAFAVAAGIIAAIDEGAQLMNLSLGTEEDNPLIRDAVSLAQAAGIIIVAASGNSVREHAAYPANYPGVISVGAIDARGMQLEFSNYGDQLSLTAPGYNINAAAPGGTIIRASGTSASTALVTGAIAAVMSDGTGASVSAQKAADIVLGHTDEAGIPGPDSQYGSGILNLGRIMNRNRPGIIDAAITQQRVVTAANGRSHEIQVTIQNRGTTVLVNVLLQVTTPAGARQINLTSLAPRAVKTVSLPIDLGSFPGNSAIIITSALSLGSNGIDITPANNHRTDHIPPSP